MSDFTPAPPPAPGGTFGARGWDDVPLPGFDAPAFNPATGELLDDEAPATPPAPAGGPLIDPSTFLPSAVAADVSTFTRELRDALNLRVGTLYSAALAARPAGPLEVAVGEEVRLLSDAEATFTAIGKVFTEAARNARGMLGDVVLEVRVEDADRLKLAGGSTSMKVGSSGKGSSATKVTVTQGTEVVTDTPAIVDVLVAHLVDGLEGPDEPATRALAYADGARDMAASLTDLTSPWKWKTTALDKLRLAVSDVLGTRLFKAYHRKATDAAPSVKVETVEVKR